MYTDKDKKIRENPFHLCVSVCYLCLFWEEPEQLYFALNSKHEYNSFSA